MTVEQIKQFISGGKWTSIAPEIRPSSVKNAGETIKPFYLTREFSYSGDDTFELTVINFADAYGKVPLGKMFIKGHMAWKGDHLIADGAQKVNFTADIEYTVTPLLQPFADAMNQYTSGYNSWELNVAQSILGKSFPPFGLGNDDIFAECDLIYISNELMFWGARNVDGRGFDKEENRPTNLQIPLERKQ